MRYEDEVRDEACSYLGREITDEEWDETLPSAQRKLDWIINREGDLNGERQKPYYLGKLVEERIRESAFSKWCDTMSKLNQQRRMVNETVPAHT